MRNPQTVPIQESPAHALGTATAASHLDHVSAAGLARFQADDPEALARLVRRAAKRDPSAWDELVTRFNPRLRAAARGFRLSAADVDDVVQATWLAALMYIDRIERPEAIATWLLVTARRAALRTLQRGAREVVSNEHLVPREPAPDSPPPPCSRPSAGRSSALRFAGSQPASARSSLPSSPPRGSPTPGSRGTSGCRSGPSAPHAAARSRVSGATPCSRRSCAPDSPLPSSRSKGTDGRCRPRRRVESSRFRVRRRSGPSRRLRSRPRRRRGARPGRSPSGY